MKGGRKEVQGNSKGDNGGAWGIGNATDSKTRIKPRTCQLQIKNCNHRQSNESASLLNMVITWSFGSDLDSVRKGFLYTEADVSPSCTIDIQRDACDSD
jgi:hypothetical protein